MTATIALRGMTWNHARGYAPMAATAQRFNELHPGVRIHWEQRSLKAFEDFPVETLAADYDLIVLDHPCITQVAPRGVLVPLDEHLPAAFLADQAEHSVGGSHASYRFGGHQWALAIDAATPVAFWRDDLLRRHDLAIPHDWPGLLDLARRGHVELPAAPINCLMNFYSLCIACGEPPFRSGDRVVSRETGRSALERLREVLSHCDASVWTRNPIGSHELLASAENDRLVYCPLAYGYSNYARAGFAAHRLMFGEPPALAGAALRTTLGGAGLAVSARRPHTQAAVAYAGFVASPQIQRTLYTQSGGQPGHRTAWLDPENNGATNDYFTQTLPVLDRAFVRPRFAGYLRFQESGSDLVHAALRGKLEADTALEQLDARYRETLALSPLSA
ncbi:MAG TPA: extracellular solute-binding protein [Opitutaceae bacterium]